MALTEAQKKVLAFLKKFHRENGYSPTRSEISAHFGWASNNAAECHLIPLQRKGAITIANGIARGIVVKC